MSDSQTVTPVTLVTPPNKGGSLLLQMLLADVESYLQRFVVLSFEQRCAITLWVASTHVTEAFDYAAYLSIFSAEKGAGKSRLLEILREVVAKPWYTFRPTAANLVRTLNSGRTLLLDESDTAFGGDKNYAEALRGVLNAGFRRGIKAPLLVSTASGWDNSEYDVFGPKAIAGIGHLPDTITDRCIPIEMRRKRPGEETQRFQLSKVSADAKQLQTRLSEWGEHEVENLKSSDPEIPELLSDRQADIWTPLLSIADTAGAFWPERVRSTAVALSRTASKEALSINGELLLAIRTVFRENGFDFISSGNLAALLNEDEAAPWASWSGDRGITGARIASMLRPFRISPQRLGGTGTRGYSAGQFVDAWQRYLPPTLSGESVTSVTTVTPLPTVGEILAGLKSFENDYEPFLPQPSTTELALDFTRMASKAPVTMEIERD